MDSRSRVASIASGRAAALHKRLTGSDFIDSEVSITAEYGEYDGPAQFPWRQL
jgi:hypothetical protein